MGNEFLRVDSDTKEDLFNLKKDYESLSGQEASFDEIIKALKQEASEENTLVKLHSLKKKKTREKKGRGSRFDELFSL